MQHCAQPICQKCGKVVPFIDPKFCCYCGSELSEEAKANAAISDQELAEIQCRQRSW